MTLRSLLRSADSTLSAFAFVSLIAPFVACSSSSKGAGESSTDAGGDAAPSDGSMGSTYGASACGTCVNQMCASAVSACSSDPDCENYASCLEACPIGSTGDVDANCASACPTGTSTSGLQAEATLNGCRTSGAGASCGACGAPDAGTNPLLTQTCPEPAAENMCAACEDTHCCMSTAACDADPTCTGFRICLQNCLSGMPQDAGLADAAAPTNEDEYACDQYCDKAHPGALTIWSKTIACPTFWCSGTDACGSEPISACQACVYQSCPNEWVAALATPDGLLFSDCINDCPSGANACTSACSQAYPSLVDALASLDACTETACPVCTQ